MKRGNGDQPLRDPLPDLSVQSLAACMLGADTRLIGAPVDGDTAYLVLSGTLHLSSEAGQIVAAAGTLVLVPAGLRPAIASSAAPGHEYFATRERLTQRGGLLVFDVTRDKETALRVMVGRVRGNLTAALSTGSPVAAQLRTVALARSAYAALRTELDRPTAGFPVLAAALIKVSLLLFLRSLRHGRSVSPASAAGERIATVVAAIRSRPADAYSLDTLAEQAGMSRATFARQFARTVGQTPMEFVLKVRLNDAAGMLRATALPIGKVASACGFQNRSHFSRAFQARYDIDPSAYRSAALLREADARDDEPPIFHKSGA